MSSGAEQSKIMENCSTAREFITAREFLRERKDLGIPEDQAHRLTTQIAEGCSGAAQRFIRVLGVLMHSGLTPNDSIKTALKLSKENDQQTETFLAVFQSAFLPEYLDLDLRSSLQLASSLSVEFEGDLVPVRDDFSKLVDFCLREDVLNLPRPQCATFAARLTRLGANWRGGISKAFIELFNYTRSSKGPSLITGQALALTEEIIAQGPGAPENFQQAYRYALSAKGLTMPQQQAIAFARQMAMRKIPAEKQDTLKEKRQEKSG